jgi:hypothetical protein
MCDAVNEPVDAVKVVPTRSPLPLRSVCEANAASRKRLGSEWRRSMSVAKVMIAPSV